MTGGVKIYLAVGFGQQVMKLQIPEVLGTFFLWD